MLKAGGKIKLLYLIRVLKGNWGGYHSVDLIVGYNCFNFFNIILAYDKKGSGSLEPKIEAGPYGEGIVDWVYAYLERGKIILGYLWEKWNVFSAVVTFIMFYLIIF